MKKFLSKILVIAFMLFGVAFTMAQNYLDLAIISYSNTPSNSFETGEQSTKVEQLDIQLDFPFVLNEKTVFLTGFSAQTNTLLLDTSLPSTSTVGYMAMEFGLNLVHSKKVSGTYMLIPRLSSDFGNIHKKDVQFGVLGLISIKKTDRLSYKFGVYANTERFGPLIVPLLGVYYKSPNNKFELNAILPASADLNYKLNKSIWAGLFFESLAGSYHLNNSTFGNNARYLNKSSNDFYFYLGLPLTKSLILKTKLGYSIARNYRLFDEDDKVTLSLSSIYFGDDRTQLNQRFDDGIIGKFELIYRFHFKD